MSAFNVYLRSRTHILIKYHQGIYIFQIFLKAMLCTVPRHGRTILLLMFTVNKAR